MQYFSRQFPSLLAMALTALLLMGAGGQVKTHVTSSIDSNVIGMASSTKSSMSSSVSSSATASVITRPTGTVVTLSPYAEELARIIRFDRQILVIVKEETQDRIGRLVGYDEKDYQIIAPGIVVSVPEEKTDRILASLRQRLRNFKYLPFVVEMNEGLKVDRIGILKTTDQYEILRIMHTDGDDYDISNQDVIERLKEWEEYAPFDIIGADNDWVEIEFKSLPRDLKAFAEEVYDFCPDAVDQGPGSVEGLIKDIKRTKRLFLWWD
jgi:hypothetical protein